MPRQLRNSVSGTGASAPRSADSGMPGEGKSTTGQGVPGAGGRSRELWLRILSSAVILPPVMALFWLGGHYFLALVVFMAAVMAWEWANLVAPECPRSLRVLTGLFGALLVLAAAQIFQKPIAFAVLLGLAAAYIVAIRLGAGAWLPKLWPGLAIALIPSISVYWLRLLPDAGLETALWLVLSVVITDVAAFAAGRTIGGPKIWLRVSPNKTWAGLLGGMAASAGFGALMGVSLAPANPWLLAVLGALIAIIAQMGDFAESALKRALGAKDSGALIPGHGGILDRVDGQIAVLPIAAALMLLSGQSMLHWSWP